MTNTRFSNELRKQYVFEDLSIHTRDVLEI